VFTRARVCVCVRARPELKEECGIVAEDARPRGLIHFKFVRDPVVFEVRVCVCVFVCVYTYTCVCVCVCVVCV